MKISIRVRLSMDERNAVCNMMKFSFLVRTVEGIIKTKQIKAILFIIIFLLYFYRFPYRLSFGFARRMIGHTVDKDDSSMCLRL